MTQLQDILAAHPFFEALENAHLELLVGCARNVRFPRDTYLFHEGEEANDFYLLRFGRVALEMVVHARPVLVTTLEPGEVVGWSWLVPPHHWHFSVRAIELTRAIALDGRCLREKCQADHDLGYELLRRFAHDIEQRLYRAWMQLVDIYGPAHGG